MRFSITNHPAMGVPSWPWKPPYWGNLFNVMTGGYCWAINTVYKMTINVDYLWWICVFSCARHLRLGRKFNGKVCGEFNVKGRSFNKFQLCISLSIIFTHVHQLQLGKHLFSGSRLTAVYYGLLALVRQSSDKKLVNIHWSLGMFNIDR